MNIKVGDQIKTVYGWREVVKVNAKSVRVKLTEGNVTIANRIVATLNPGLLGDVATDVNDVAHPIHY